MAPSADQQETMFDEPTGFETVYEGEPAYEAADEEPAELSAHSSEPQSTEIEHSPEPAPAPAVTAEAPGVLTVDDFAALEERVLAAVGLVRRERQARIAAEEHAATLASEISTLKTETSVVDKLQQEIHDLRAEREQVRLRVERLLSQLDALEI